jgi:hypothetical protein
VNIKTGEKLGAVPTLSFRLCHDYYHCHCEPKEKQS